jgi:hypothetical protein
VDSLRDAASPLDDVTTGVPRAARAALEGGGAWTVPAGGAMAEALPELWAPPSDDPASGPATSKQTGWLPISVPCTPSLCGSRTTHNTKRTRQDEVLEADSVHFAVWCRKVAGQQRKLHR